MFDFLSKKKIDEGFKKMVVANFGYTIPKGEKHIAKMQLIQMTSKDKCGHYWKFYDLRPSCKLHAMCGKCGKQHCYREGSWVLS